MYKSHINTVHIEVTDRCNAECPACPRNMAGSHIKPYVKNQELSLDYFKLLGPDFCSKIEWWNFCGTKGDPGSAQDLFEIIDYLLECNPKTMIEIRTNGGARNPKFWKKVGERFKGTMCAVAWSIDGWGDNNAVYRRNVKWNKVYENLLAYLSTGSRTLWEFSKFAHNIEDIPIINAFCRKYGIHFIPREPFGFEDIEHNSGDARETLRTLPVYKIHDDDTAILDYEIYPYNADKVNLVSDHPKTLRKEEFATGVFTPEQFTNLKGTEIGLTCEASAELNRQEVFIDSNGMILPCCYIAGKYVMGDEQLVQMFSPIEKELTVSDNNTVYDVLNHTLFKKTMPDALSGNLDDEIGYCITCVHHCKNKSDK